VVTNNKPLIPITPNTNNNRAPIHMRCCYYSYKNKNLYELHHDLLTILFLFLFLFWFKVIILLRLLRPLAAVAPGVGRGALGAHHVDARHAQVRAVRAGPAHGPVVQSVRVCVRVCACVCVWTCSTRVWAVLVQLQCRCVC
jgi:hypothetical protein